MNAENTKSFLMVLENQLAAEAAGWEKVRQQVEKPDWQSNEQTAKALDLQKIRQTVEQAGKTLVEYINRFAGRLEQLGTRAQNAGMDADNLKALEYGAAQTGLSNEAIASALQTIMNHPQTLNKLGIATQDESGQKRAAGTIMSDASAALGAMPQAEALETARQLGLAPDVLAAMQKGLGKFIGDYNQLSTSLGANMTAAVSGADRFMTARRKFDEVVELLQINGSSRLNNGLGDIFDRFTQDLLANAPDVQRVLDGAVTLLLRLADIGEKVVLRLIQAAADVSGWWESLDGFTQELIVALGAVTTAWLLFNSGFLASPAGIILMLGAAIFALYDSYKTWQEGGDTFIDWDAWMPGIEAAKTAIGWLIDKFEKLCAGTLDWQDGLQTIADFLSGNWSPAMKEAVDQVRNYFNNLFTDITDKLANSPLWRGLTRIGSALKESGQEFMETVQGVLTAQSSSAALGNWQALSLKNVPAINARMDAMAAPENHRQPWQSEISAPGSVRPVDVKQETKIYIEGASDPHLTATKVADSQFDVNAIFVQKLSRIPK
ncbi:hypothetical protein [Erwinia sp. CGal63]|uniref:hypothetical protein n=1 Tax=Erwinia sp. CGal63 TaxID=2919889 RepID=UPI00300B686E